MRSWILLSIGIVCFSLIGIFRDLSLSWPSELLAFMRLAGAVLILRLFIFRGSLKPVKSMRVWAEFALIGALFAMSFTFYLDAFVHTPVAEIKLLGFLDPIIVLLLSGAFLGERVSSKSVAAAMLAVFGIAMLINPLDVQSVSNYGILLAILSFAGGAGATLLIRKSEHDAPMSEVVIYPFAFGALLVAIHLVLFRPDMYGAQLSQWPAVAGLIAITAIGYYTFDEAIRRLGAHMADLWLRIGVAILGSALSIIILGQELDPLWWPAAAMLFASGILLYSARNDGKPIARGGRKKALRAK